MGGSLCGVVGVGTMGAQVAALLSAHGHDVLLFDSIPKEDWMNRVTRSQRLLQRALKAAGCAPGPAGECRLVGRMESLESASIVIECVVEDASTKQTVLSALAQIVSSDTIIATNTSSLRVSNLSEAVTYPTRFIGTHFFNPIHAVTLVEVCRTPVTDEKCVGAVTAMLEQMGRMVVMVPDTPGFIVNRLLFAMLATAMRSCEDGVSPEEIDRAMKTGTNAPLGPLELADLIGLDVCLRILENLSDQTAESVFAPPTILRRKVQQGQIGRKAGCGFHGRAQ